MTVAESTLPKAKDLSHHLSVEAKSRRSSPLKVAFQYYNRPDIVFLGGGLPLSDYFPFKDISFEAPNNPFPNGIGALPSGDAEKGDTLFANVPKTADLATQSLTNNGYSDVLLENSLQYGFTEGSTSLRNFMRDHTALIHKIPYQDWNVISTVGNTQAWDAVLRTFCTRGSTILVEEFSFSSALETAHAQGVVCFPVSMDDYGIIPEKLEQVLANWKYNADKSNFPKLFYTIPTGQNPTGSTLSSERRKAIYDICSKYDIIIIEDEPYYFLQMETYDENKEAREAHSVSDPKQFLGSLVKSFLDFDIDGRVLRLDSFSKVIAPGCRIGWIVGQEKLLERFVRLHEVTIQAPSGFAQSTLLALLARWGQEGYLNWLMGLRKEYTHKRDVAIDALNTYVPRKIAKWVPPTAGMFFTVHLDASKHPKFATEFGSDPLKVENAIYETGLKTGTLMIPGSWFAVEADSELAQGSSEKSNYIFFRGTYAAVPLDQLVKGIERFGKAVETEFAL